MEFREYATRETQAFVDRLAAAAEAMRVELEDRLQAVTTDLDSAIEAHRQVDAQRAAADAAREQEAAARAQADAARTRAEAARAQAEAARTEADATRAQADAARAQAETELRAARELAERAREEAARLVEALEEEASQKAIAHEELTRIRADLATTEQLRDSAIKDRERRAAENAKVVAELEEVRAERAAIAEELAEAHAQLDASHEHYQQQAGRMRELERRLHDAEAATASMLQASGEALDVLDAAATVTALFAALVEQTAAELPRVALFRVKGNHLEGEHVAGAGPGVSVTKLVIPMSVGALVTRAVTRGMLERASGDQLAGTRSPFGDTPPSALAAPVVFQRETLAVLYADSDRPVTDVQSAFVSLLIRHATIVLAKLTQELKAQKELREYAAMLLQEAEQMFVADAEAGSSDQDCLRRLDETLDCGRQLYAQRAALEGTVAANLLEEQIAAIVRSPESRFARALAAVVAGLQEQRTAS